MDTALEVLTGHDEQELASDTLEMEPKMPVVPGGHIVQVIVFVVVEYVPT